MMKEKNRGRRTFQGEDRQPKSVKEEVGLEMRPKKQEPPPNSLPGKGRENGLRQAERGQNRLEPQQPEPGTANGEELPVDPRGGAGSGALAFGTCRPQLGELPHWCLECGKNFGQKAELEKHQLNHAGPCSYICRDCGRSFVEHVAFATRQGGCTAAGSSFSPAGCRRRTLPLSSETVVQRKERKELSLQEKVRVLEMLEGPKVSQSELAKRFGVSQPQICRIIKNKERILAEWCKNANPGRKRKLEEKAAAGDAALLQWFERSYASSAPANGMHLPDTAQRLSETLGKPELEASMGWLSGFSARHKVALERPLAEKRNGEPPEVACWENTVLPYVLSKYDPPDVYACGEAAILFRATPEDPALEKREEGRDQLTVLLCVNMDASDQRDALIVGKTPRPFGFQGANAPAFPPVAYRANGKAWMTAAIFTEWLQKFNDDMKRRRRSVVLFLVQCGAHPYVEFSNVKMFFMPPGSSRIHPLEQGVIQNFKCNYRRRMLIRLLVALDSKASAPTSRLSKHLALLDAIHMIVQAWSEICPQTVKNGFQAAGFGSNSRILTPPADVVHALGFKTQEQFERFVLVDEGLECFGDQDGAETVKDVQPGQEPTCATAEDELKREDLALPPCPSKAEVMESLAKLRSYFECHSVPSTVFQTFYKLEDMVHGMSLADMQGLRIKALNNN
ncbi:tigger transposable element-derived protein 3-like [Elgaria multicarinata webbii]|uniref:tigger transposable element-derived protein 3-like n=1 Tax=Elgaria multicarinata webbii TaxID=159646 RepID=UPI002FCCD884